MNWIDIARDNLAAARSLVKTHPRSAVARAYYAAHSVLTQSLLNAGYSPAANRQTPPHQRQGKLVSTHFHAWEPLRTKRVKQAISRAYSRRLDADYSAGVTMDDTVAREAVRDAHRLFVLLEVTP